MKIERFEDMEAWKQARELVKYIYICFVDNELPRSPEGFRDEVSNISTPSRGGDEEEGFETNHHKTPPP